jgi:Holliday junction resolvase RusA-like endonuclease
MKFVIAGNPIAQKRARHCKIGEFIRVYDPSSNDQNRIKSELLLQLDSQLICSTPIFTQETAIRVYLTFYMPIPKSVSKSKRIALWMKPHISKPDIDNLAVIILNAMSGLIYHDDRQISQLVLKKVYHDDPRTTIEVLCD